MFLNHWYSTGMYGWMDGCSEFFISLVCVALSYLTSFIPPLFPLPMELTFLFICLPESLNQ